MDKGPGLQFVALHLCATVESEDLADGRLVEIEKKHEPTMMYLIYINLT